ncbi:MAG TPA: ATP-binding protein [Holophagaceae bacterium]|nr:ATP-binding protein [Holophagaceae bacterium]
MPKANPFKPGSPVPTAMFAGRYEELIELEKGLFQAKTNSANHYLITGERGIGKSSLLLYLKHVSAGGISSIKHGSFNYLTIAISISDKTGLNTLIRLIERHISRELGKIEGLRNFLTDTWAFVQRLKVMDSGIEAVRTEQDADIIIDDFAHSLAETCKRISSQEKGEGKKDGIVILIDECDNACSDLRLGYFIKKVTEDLRQYECNNLMFVFVGLPDVIEKLISSHESSVRIFTQIEIKELSVSDRKYVIEKGIEEGNRLNEEKTTITTDALTNISTLSEGYPHFIQQFAYSAFDVNEDGEISVDDVLKGAFKTDGAIDAIGNRYYASAFHDKIKSDEYREVLSIMADNYNEWVKKSEIQKKFKGEYTTLTNALQALTNRKIILKNPSQIGEYRLQQRGFALWIKIFGDRKKRIGTPSS